MTPQPKDWTRHLKSGTSQNDLSMVIAKFDQKNRGSDFINSKK